jgi:hypothetical protein
MVVIHFTGNRERLETPFIGMIMHLIQSGPQLRLFPGIAIIIERFQKVIFLMNLEKP